MRACHALAGGAVAVTLMACYGAPAHYQLAQPMPADPSCSEPGSGDQDCAAQDEPADEGPAANDEDPGQAEDLPAEEVGEEGLDE